MNFYHHHLGDYAKDTRGLSPLEHGCYRLLLDHNYATEQPVPNDVKEVYRIVGATTPAERKAAEKIVERFFPVNGDGRRHNKRAEEEIARAMEKSAKARGSAERRWGRSEDADATDMRTHQERNAIQEPVTKETKTSPAIAGEARDVVATVPDCPHEKLLALYHELLPTCTPVIEWNDARRAVMRARWREKAVSKEKRWGYATVEDGLACWRRFFMWVSQSKFLIGQSDTKPGERPFVATLEWLVRPKNFAKVVEGNYHR